MARKDPPEEKLNLAEVINSGCPDTRNTLKSRRHSAFISSFGTTPKRTRPISHVIDQSRMSRIVAENSRLPIETNFSDKSRCLATFIGFLRIKCQSQAGNCGIIIPLLVEINPVRFKHVKSRCHQFTDSGPIGADITSTFFKSEPTYGWPVLSSPWHKNRSINYGRSGMNIVPLDWRSSRMNRMTIITSAVPLKSVVPTLVPDRRYRRAGSLQGRLSSGSSTATMEA